MGKRKALSEKDLHDMVLPSANDVLGVVQKMLGFDRVQVDQLKQRGRLKIE